MMPQPWPALSICAPMSLLNCVSTGNYVSIRVSWVRLCAASAGRRGQHGAPTTATAVG